MPDEAEQALHHTLERLALADWKPGSATVTSIVVRATRAEVVLKLNKSYDYWVYLARSESGPWQEAVSSNGPTDGWDDPSVIEWDDEAL